MKKQANLMVSRIRLALDICTRRSPDDPLCDICRESSPQSVMGVPVLAAGSEGHLKSVVLPQDGLKPREVNEVLRRVGMGRMQHPGGMDEKDHAG